MSTSEFRVAVLVSGTGTNLQALIDTVHGRGGVRIVAVASDKEDAAALGRARAAGIAAGLFPASAFTGGRRERDRAMAAWLADKAVDLVVLAGYMQLLGPEFLDAFQDRVINVHPALLPAFPGLDAVGQALAYGVKVFGVTVHFVDGGVDSGRIILQRAVELPDASGSDEVFAALHPLEHELLPEAVRLFAAGRVVIDRTHPRRVTVGPVLGGSGSVTRLHGDPPSPWETQFRFSRVIQAGSLVKIGGTTSADPLGFVIGETPREQTIEILRKLEHELTRAGCALSDVIDVHAYVTDISRGEEVGMAFADVFGTIRPLMTMVEVSALIDPRLLVEIELTAYTPA